jgi:FtsP/CotA-like multicopper oxidase with cupredoxin domain
MAGMEPPPTSSAAQKEGAGPKAKPHAGPTRHYYIAAEPINWSYAPFGKDRVQGQRLPPPWQDNPTYPKYHYVQYTDDTFKTPVKQPPWLGILGPIIRGVVGDTLEVTFLNRTDKVFSIHPHGVRYDKEDEGAYYPPNPGHGAWVIPHDKYTYTWYVDKEAGPGPGEPSSKVWLYHSHVMADADINMGLVGAIVITDRAHARADGSPNDVDREFVTLFMIFNENGDIATDTEIEDDPVLEKKRAQYRKLSPAAQAEFLEGGLKHAINGYIFGNLPGLEMMNGEHVRWYVLALGSEQDLHVAHWHGKTVLEDQRRRTDDIELLPGSMKVADMNADNPGTWMFHCHVADHMMGGMYAYYTIDPKPYTQRPKPKKTAAATTRHHNKQGG